MQQAVQTYPEPTHRATYQDVLDAPPHKVAEVINGTLYPQPRPAMPHALAVSSLGDEFVGPYQKGRGGPGGWWIVFEPELHLGEDIIVPDLAGWRRERMPQYPDAAYCALAPDWVCEILSPSTRNIDYGEKRDIYAREGVPWLWFIDPAARTLEALELRDGRWIQLAVLTDNADVSIPPFDATTFPLNALWPEGAGGSPR